MESLLINRDLFLEIFSQLYVSCYFDLKGKFVGKDEEYVIPKLGNIIKSLTCVSKQFNFIFSDERMAKGILILLKEDFPREYIPDILRYLNFKGGIFHQINDKINNLFDIVYDSNKNFQEDDLKDVWYLNITMMVDDYTLKTKLLPYKNWNSNSIDKIKCKVETFYLQSLLPIAIKTRNLDKITKLLENGVDVNNFILTDIAKNRVNPKEKHKINKRYYLIAGQLLLEYGAKRIVNRSKSYPTALMTAVYNDDEEYAFILLKYGMSINEKVKCPVSCLTFPFYYHGKEKEMNVLDIAKDKQWFHDMLKSIK